MGHMKLSEARVLVLLENIPENIRYAGFIAGKLDMDYQHLLMKLKAMQQKGWISRIPGKVKKFYSLTPEAPLNEAKEKLIGGENHAGENDNKKNL